MRDSTCRKCPSAPLAHRPGWARRPLSSGRHGDCWDSAFGTFGRPNDSNGIFGRPEDRVILEPWILGFDAYMVSEWRASWKLELHPKNPETFLKPFKIPGLNGFKLPGFGGSRVLCSKVPRFEASPWFHSTKAKFKVVGFKSWQGLTVPIF